MPCARSSPANNKDIEGEWLSTSIVAGKNIANGSMKTPSTRLIIFRKPNGHYGMRILGDTLPDVTAMWDAVRRGPTTYEIRYQWPQKPPGIGVEEFNGTLEYRAGVVIRDTIQSNHAYPGESTHVNSRWTRIPHGTRGPDPALSYRNGTLYSHDIPVTDEDGTRTGGRYIERRLFDAPCYRESAPGFDAPPTSDR